MQLKSQSEMKKTNPIKSNGYHNQRVARTSIVQSRHSGPHIKKAEQEENKNRFDEAVGEEEEAEEEEEEEGPLILYDHIAEKDKKRESSRKCVGSIGSCITKA